MVLIKLETIWYYYRNLNCSLISSAVWTLLNEGEAVSVFRILIIIFFQLLSPAEIAPLRKLLCIRQRVNYVSITVFPITPDLSGFELCVRKVFLSLGASLFSSPIRSLLSWGKVIKADRKRQRLLCLLTFWIASLSQRPPVPAPLDCFHAPKGKVPTPTNKPAHTAEMFSF